MKKPEIEQKLHSQLGTLLAQVDLMPHERAAWVKAYINTSDNNKLTAAWRASRAISKLLELIIISRLGTDFVYNIINEEESG